MAKDIGAKRSSRSSGTLMDTVRNHVRDEIITGKYVPGDRLREVDIAARLGVSRSPIREAIKALEAEGLIVAEPWKGIVVAKLTRLQAAELFQFRETLEGLAAALAARSITEMELRQLEELARQMEACAPDQVETLLRINRQFHEKIYDASHNRFLIQSLDTLRASMALLPGSVFSVKSRWRPILQEHRALLNALTERDPDKANAAARAHVRNSAYVRLAAMINQETSADGE